MRRYVAQMLFAMVAVLVTGCGAKPGGEDTKVYEWQAMGTRMRLFVRGGDAETIGPEMFSAAKTTMEAVEAETSAFRTNSSVSRVSSAAGSGEWIATGVEFDDALAIALDVAKRSGGAFNPLVAPLVAARGFPRGGVAASDSAALLDISRIEHRPGACRLADQVMALDLGGVAKGLGVDRAVDAVRTVSTNDFLIDAGGNLKGRGEWTIGVRDPRLPADAKPLRVLPLPDGAAAATSGNYERFVVSSDGTRTGHLFDPRTGEPACDTVLQVTTLAPRAVVADAWSTALFVLGFDDGLKAISELPIVALWVLPSEGGAVRLESSRSLAEFAD